MTRRSWSEHELGVAAQELEVGARRDHGRVDVLEHLDRGGRRRVADHRQVTDHLAGTAQGEDVLVTVVGRRDDLDQAVEQHDHGAQPLALADDALASLVSPRPTDQAQLVEQLGRQHDSASVALGASVQASKSSWSISMALPRTSLCRTSAGRWPMSFWAVSCECGHVESECG